MINWKPTIGESVTINLSTANHYTNGKINFNEGDKIFLAKKLWEHTQNTKNRRIVFRMLKKKYHPFTTIDKVIQLDNTTTLTLNQFQF